MMMIVSTEPCVDDPHNMPKIHYLMLDLTDREKEFRFRIQTDESAQLLSLSSRQREAHHRAESIPFFQRKLFLERTTLVFDPRLQQELSVIRGQWRSEYSIYVKSRIQNKMAIIEGAYVLLEERQMAEEERYSWACEVVRHGGDALYLECFTNAFGALPSSSSSSLEDNPQKKKAVTPHHHHDEEGNQKINSPAASSVEYDDGGDNCAADLNNEGGNFKKQKCKMIRSLSSSSTSRNNCGLHPISLLLLHSLLIRVQPECHFSRSVMEEYKSWQRRELSWRKFGSTSKRRGVVASQRNNIHLSQEKEVLSLSNVKPVVACHTTFAVPDVQVIMGSSIKEDTIMNTTKNEVPMTTIINLQKINATTFPSMFDTFLSLLDQFKADLAQEIHTLHVMAEFQEELHAARCSDLEKVEERTHQGVLQDEEYAFKLSIVKQFSAQTPIIFQLGERRRMKRRLLESTEFEQRFQCVFLLEKADRKVVFGNIQDIPRSSLVLEESASFLKLMQQCTLERNQWLEAEQCRLRMDDLFRLQFKMRWSVALKEKQMWEEIFS